MGTSRHWGRPRFFQDGEGIGADLLMDCASLHLSYGFTLIRVIWRAEAFRYIDFA